MIIIAVVIPESSVTPQGVIDSIAMVYESVLPTILPAESPSYRLLLEAVEMLQNFTTMVTILSGPFFVCLQRAPVVGPYSSSEYDLGKGIISPRTAIRVVLAQIRF